MAEGEVVRAAGGVVWRRAESGGVVEIVLIHRPRHGDWSLPKGKAEPGETDEECALREVEEETGLRCALGRLLGEVSYQDGHDRPKRVRYWAMRPLGGELARPTDEVDFVRWVPIGEAFALLTHERDAEIVRRL